ncbi:MAG TPA: VCBS repeat-containing protein, partial [Xanthobacteraceae bacterium]|nr:VCBS repeat-containing protein [Xanthobacteraceae bacterium]
FNGDGKDDLLWRHDNGTITTWEMNGSTATANAFSAFVGNDWDVAGTRDFNGDGTDDLLWRHHCGTITTWHMNGNTATTNAFTAAVSNDWTVFSQPYDFV